MSRVIDRPRAARSGLRRRTRWMALGCSALALALAAPAGQAAETETQVFINLASELGGYVPHQNTGPEIYSFFRHVYDPLVNANRSEYAPGLACSWERPDPTTWRFHLCPEATFADGTPVTSDDVLFTFDLLANDPTSLQIGSVRAITEVVAVDAHTVDFLTEEPNSMFWARSGIAASRAGPITRRSAPKRRRRPRWDRDPTPSPRSGPASATCSSAATITGPPTCCPTCTPPSPRGRRPTD